MARFQSVDEVLSALYVDFDNIYSRLLEQDANIAKAFATNPARWMRWIEGHALRMMYGDGVRRRILKRCCYMSAEYYNEYKSAFARAAFQVYDCPPVCGHRKSTADVQLVVDCMDALYHTTRYDEFIILSGDADYTPFLLRCQESARRSLILSMGYTSPAYAAVCTWRIREDWFITQALEDETADDAEGGPSGRESSGRDPSGKDQADGNVNSSPRRGAGNASSAPQPAGQPAESSAPRISRAPQSAINLPAATRARLVDVIKELVAESSVPVPLPSIAQVLQCGMDTGSDWYGVGTLGKLLESLDLSPCEFTKAGQGYVFDPERHKTAQQTGDGGEANWNDPEIFELAQKVHARTDAPLLNPAQYAGLFSLIAREITAKGGLKSQVVKRIEASCADEQLPLNAAQIEFVVNTLFGNSPRIKSPARNGQGSEPQTLSETFQSRILELCATARVSLSTEDKILLGIWLTGDGA